MARQFRIAMLVSRRIFVRHGYFLPFNSDEDSSSLDHAGARNHTHNFAIYLLLAPTLILHLGSRPIPRVIGKRFADEFCEKNL
jgi:hypothetical protein